MERYCLILSFHLVPIGCLSDHKFGQSKALKDTLLNMPEIRFLQVLGTQLYRSLQKKRPKKPEK